MKNAIVDYRIDDVEKENLIAFGCNIIECPPSSILYDAVCGHPDMLMNIVNNDLIILHKDTDRAFVSQLQAMEKNIVFSENSLMTSYPYDIILNALSIRNMFIHSLKHTDSKLLEASRGKELINVRQGYTKCSTALISNSAAITSDTGIASALNSRGIDVLLLPPGGILLPGLNYGFIGGTCGLFDKNHLAFYGDLEFYIYGKEVIAFLKKHKVEPLFLKKGPLVDRGSLFIIE